MRAAPYGGMGIVGPGYSPKSPNYKKSKSKSDVKMAKHEASESPAKERREEAAERKNKK